jgi:PAS domain S-box-containing protein
MDDSARDEFGMLARYFNSFMETLQQFSGSLQEEVLEHRMSLDALRESEERFRLLAENSPDIIISLDQRGYISYVNPVVEKILGYAPHELAGESFLVMAREQEAGEYTRQFRKVRNGEIIVDYTGVLVHKNGSVRHFIFCGAPATDGQGNMMGIEGFLKDITDRRNLEFQLQQVQKLEAVGTLAGGVAHDFNNILTAIRGSLDISLLMVGQNDPILKNLQQIEKAVTRATDLTRQLLFFSRRQSVEMAPLNLNQSVDNILRIIERLIGENITITVDLSPDLQPVMADGGNIEQVIMNLMINARDAMPEGGAITIRTRDATVDDDYVRTHSYARPGRFVCLSMEDTGIGMDGETVEHIFEPFFTTKEQGKGTGLGLAVVYGIVKKHKGWIVADSRPGEGTVFSIFFPVFAEGPGKVPGRDARVPGDSRGRGEKILVIEDDSGVLSFAGTVLQTNGYTVLTAASAMEARVVFHEHQDSLDLIFSDVVLPDKNGLDLVDEFESEKPGIRVLMTSGYMDENSLSRIIRDNGHRFLPKPYAMKDLLVTVRVLLDNPVRA